MKTPSNQISKNNFRARRVRHDGLTISKMFMALLVTFTAVAAMQAFQLNRLLSDAKAIGQNTSRLRAEQEIILSEYSFYKNILPDNIYVRN